MTSGRLLALLLSLSVALGPRASAEPGGGLVMACFTPHLGFASALERGAWFQALARRISEVSGVPITVKGFSLARDFDGFVRRRGPGMLVLVNSLHGRAKGFEPLLQAVAAGGDPTPPMVLASRDARTLRSLAGSTVILPAMGGGEKRLLEGLVLEGEAKASKFFGKVMEAPDASSSVSAVALGKADAAFVYGFVAAGKGLTELVRVDGMPLPMIMVSGELPEEFLDAVIGALTGGRGGGGGVMGWRPADPGLVGRFVARLSPRRKDLYFPASLPRLPMPKGGPRVGLEPWPAHLGFDPKRYRPASDFLPKGRPFQSAAPKSAGPYLAPSRGAGGGE